MARPLGVGDDEVAVLFVGRLSHHAKAHPFPMFRGVELAAEDDGPRASTSSCPAGRRTPPIRQAFEDGARAFAPSVRVTFVDGMDPGDSARRLAMRPTSSRRSADNIQETFGLVVIEAMACGLPVVASDWDGYRDLVEDGVTGLLVPTTMVDGATAGLDLAAAVRRVRLRPFPGRDQPGRRPSTRQPPARPIARLIGDEGLRASDGRGGPPASRCRALCVASRHRGVRALWKSQEDERRHLSHRPAPGPSRPRRCIPDVGTTFAGLPVALARRRRSGRGDRDCRAGRRGSSPCR